MAAVNVPELVRNRSIDGISAVLLPYSETSRPDWETFGGLLERTWRCGLTPAINMDTGYVNLLTVAERAEVLGLAAQLARGRRFIAGAFVEDADGPAEIAYSRAVEEIRKHGGTPILFQCTALSRSSEEDVLAAYRRIGAAGGPMFAFELGTMFAPFGRIYSSEFFRRLLDIEAFEGLKHSSLDRESEWTRLAIRDRHRPAFRVYTGNDLAIDMVFYGSDYLLGLSAFDVDSFAERDRCWVAGDARALAINDLLQYLGQYAFRPPVPAYKHSAAQFLKLRGLIPCDRTHPRSPQRPDTDLAVLDDIRRRLDALG
jgi:dihydrodipicolinate synthase/N-acetylneuraminate lyase